MASQLLGIKTRFTNDLGSPLVGGQVYTFFAGTSTQQDTYSDAALTVPNTNPVILDDTGSADIFLKGTYRIRVFDVLGKFIEEQDNVTQTTSQTETIELTQRLINSENAIAALPFDSNKKLQATSVTVSASGEGTIARSLSDVVSDVVSVKLFSSVIAAEAYAKANNVKIFLPSGEYATTVNPDITVFWGNGQIKNTTMNKVFKPINGGFITPEMFGAIGDGVTDDSVALNLTAEYGYATKLPIVGASENGYHISANVEVFSDIKLSKLVLPKGTSYASLIIKSKKVPTTIALASLGGLAIKSPKITGFTTDMIGKYIRFSSTTAILTERNNPPLPQYYYKNTTFKLLDSAGRISPRLDMTIGSAEDVKVEVMPLEDEITVVIDFIDVVGVGTYTNASVTNLRDNCKIHIGGASTSANFKTLFSQQGNNVTLTGSYSGATFAGLGYGISTGNCCDTFIRSVSADNSRRGLDGRHSSNVFVYDSTFSDAGTHWGNNFRFYNSTFNDLAWAGQDLLLDDCTMNGFLALRSDTWYATGDLVIKNLTSNGVYLMLTTANLASGIYSTPREFFSSIDIDGVVFHSAPASLMSWGAIPQSPLIAPSSIKINNIDARKSDNLLVTSMQFNTAVDTTAVGDITLSNIKTSNIGKSVVIIRGSESVTAKGYKLNIKNVGKLQLNIDDNVATKGLIEDSTLLIHKNLVVRPVAGWYEYRNVEFDFDATLGAQIFSTKVEKVIKNSHYKGVFNNAGATNGAITSAVGNTASVGATGYPTPLDYYPALPVAP